MDICIGSNLKRLRKMKDITQEELAEILSVSFQSVSKWERGECYPDISLLPGIANFFGVTIDELLGMSDIRNQMHLGDIYKQAHDLEKKEKYSEAAALLRKAIKLFPNNYGLLSELAIAMSSEEMRTVFGKNALEEALVLSERVLDNCTNEKIKSTTRANLCFIYHHLGENLKAVSLARILPHIWESREMLLPEMMGGNDHISALYASTKTVLHFLSMQIDSIHTNATPAGWYQEIVNTGLPDIMMSTDEMLDRISTFLEYTP